MCPPWQIKSVLFGGGFVCRILIFFERHCTCCCNSWNLEDPFQMAYPGLGDVRIVRIHCIPGQNPLRIHQLYINIRLLNIFPATIHNKLYFKIFEQRIKISTNYPSTIRCMFIAWFSSPLARVRSWDGTCAMTLVEARCCMS